MTKSIKNNKAKLTARFSGTRKASKVSPINIKLGRSDSKTIMVYNFKEALDLF